MSRPTDPRPRRVAVWARRNRRPLTAVLAGVAVVAVLFAVRAADREPPAREVPLSVLLAELGTATEASMRDTNRTVTVTLDDGSRLEAVYPAELGPVVFDRLETAGVEVTAAPPLDEPLWQVLLTALLPFVIIIAALWYFTRGRMTSMTKLGGRRGKAVDVPATTLADVAGMPEVVDELAEVVALLSDPSRYAHTGARTPTGFLLEGPPGTGKTLLARAVAGEAGVAFFALAGSDFVEMYAGLGASRVRQLFAQARKAGKAVVFIDEIDAIGRKRTSSSNPGDSERESTLNALLVEMDGFARDGSIVVLAATNRADLLDSALTRPGRFDRTVTVPLPDRSARAAILAMHATGKPVADRVDLDGLSRRTSGMSGADLENLLNQAALLAARAGSALIDVDHLEEALATVVMGRARTGAVVSDTDREITAWHEAGHAVAAAVQPANPDPVTVTIIPRGSAGGVTWMDGFDDVFFTRSQATARLVTAMAGRAAEELLLDGDFTQGAHGDFSSATNLARSMVQHYGMSGLGPAVRDTPTGAEADAVAAEVDRLLADALAAARGLLTERRAAVAAVAAALLAEETLDADQVRSIIAAHPAG